MSSFRFVKLASLYPGFAERLATRLDSQAGYEELHRHVIATRYGLSDFYSRRLRKLGHEAEELFLFTPLLRAWAREHGTPASDDPGILLAQVAGLQPDIVYLQDLHTFDRAFRDRLRQELPGCRLVGWRASPTTDFASLADLDLVLTSAPAFVEHFRDAGASARLLRHAFAPEIVGEVPVRTRDLPLTFLGSLTSAKGVHARRTALLVELLEATPLEAWGEEAADPPPRRSLAGRAAYRAQGILASAGMSKGMRGRLPLIGRAAGWEPETPAGSTFERYGRRVHPAAFGLEYYAILARSLVTLNAHGDAPGLDAANMRLFEATGMGACQLTDLQQDVVELFDPDREVVVYESPEDCLERAAYLLDNPRQAQAIADAGRARVLAEHTYDQRVPELEEALRCVLT